jgi:Xaa-Pro aminopeptidase
MSLNEELAIKRQRVAELMEREELAGLALMRNSNVSWALCGAEASLAPHSESAAALVLFTAQGDYVLANEIEAPRLAAEVLPGLPFELVTYSWYESGRLAQLVVELSGGGPVGGDSEFMPYRVDAALTEARAVLTLEEQDRLRDLGVRAGDALSTAVGEIAPGMREFAVAGLISEECYLRDIAPVLVLVGSDERAQHFRHPIPTTRVVEKYVMLVLCARRHGLVVSLTRLLHFGPLSDALIERNRACAEVDAAAIVASRPGTGAAEVFAAMQAAYARVGFADAWTQHHQGGATGYEIRDWMAHAGSPHRISAGQALAWNPSLEGVKCEDTILVTDNGWELLTESKNWPTIAIPVGATLVARPAILEVD